MHLSLVAAQNLDRVTHVTFRWYTAEHHLNIRLAFDNRINEFGPLCFMPILAVAGAIGLTTAGRALATGLDAQ